MEISGWGLRVGFSGWGLSVGVATGGRSVGFERGGCNAGLQRGGFSQPAPASPIMKAAAGFAFLSHLPTLLLLPALHPARSATCKAVLRDSAASCGRRRSWRTPWPSLLAMPPRQRRQRQQRQRRRQKQGQRHGSLGQRVEMGQARAALLVLLVVLGRGQRLRRRLGRSPWTRSCPGVWNHRPPGGSHLPTPPGQTPAPGRQARQGRRQQGRGQGEAWRLGLKWCPPTCVSL